jgi:hypothetical protein
MPRAPLAVYALFVAACAGAPATPCGAAASSGAWTELRVSWDYGPCPADGRSCHQTLVVAPDGGYVASEAPNTSSASGGEAARHHAALDSREIEELHRIVPAFVDKLGSFGCPPEYDATVSAELYGPWGVKREEVGGCVRSPDSAPNAPRALVQLLERHRFATRDAPSTRPARPARPARAGDPCSIEVGCDEGLVCAVFPCAVAPCVSGSCQEARAAGSRAVVAGSCNWARVLSMCVEYVAKDPADTTRVLERSGCKSQPAKEACPSAAVVGSCEISEEGRKVEGRVVEEELRRARLVVYRYYSDGPHPFTAESARAACARENGRWRD